MRCFSCHGLSIRSLCSACREEFFVPTIGTRQVGTLDVVSFFRYSTIEPLLLHKHKPEGYRIFRDLAEMMMKPFIQNFTLEDDSPLVIIGIDETVKNGYSHIACLTHSMKTAVARPLHASLLSQNSVRYAGKTLQYRLDHPRDFRYSGEEGVDAILIDDIITTGITLQEAQATLQAHGVNVLFALTLADARE